MKIAFPCTGCGKMLKARPDSVGRTRKCPVCATRVTCPEPVVVAEPVEEEIVDAEIVEAEVVPTAKPDRVRSRPAPIVRRGTPTPEPATPPALNPLADVDDDPYQLADPDPVIDAPSEARKPCPMCGETIMASAVKCRFCGEVFDARLKKGQSKKRRKSSGGGGSSSTGARDIGIGVLCMALGIGLTVATFTAASGDSNGGGRFVVFYGLVIGGFAQMCRGIYVLFTS
jgi:hypothetical protein